MIQFFIKYEHNDNEQFQISKKMKTRYKNPKKILHNTVRIANHIHTHIPDGEGEVHGEGRGRRKGRREN